MSATVPLILAWPGLEPGEPAEDLRARIEGTAEVAKWAALNIDACATYRHITGTARKDVIEYMADGFSNACYELGSEFDSAAFLLACNLRAAV